jgi:hypothetical protein
MFKSLEQPYQHSGSTLHYLGIENQSAKKLAMITSCHHINQGSEYQMICTRSRGYVAASRMAWSSWWENRKWDNYHCVTYQRGSTPRDLAPMTNHREIRPSMLWQNQPTQSCHLDVKAWVGWTTFWCSTIPLGIERTKVVRHSCLTKGSQILSSWMENTHKLSIFPYSTLLVINGEYMNYLQ